MKKTVFIFAAMMASTWLFAAAPCYFPVDGSTAGVWHFDEGSGTYFLDSSGNNNNGSTSGATWGAGKYGTALYFDGSNDTAFIPNAAMLNPGLGNYTVEFWVRTSQASPSIHLFQKFNQPDYDMWYIDLMAGGSFFSYFGEGVDGGSMQHWGANCSSAAGFNNGNWHYVAVVLDRAALRIRTSIDGVEICSNVFASDTHPLSNVEAIILGGDVWGHFNGAIDELRISNSARSAAEIMDYWNCAIGATPTVTPTHTDTYTETQTWTVSPTFTETSSYTATPSFTMTASPTSTSTTTPTFTATQTGTPTFTVTETGTDTYTVTATYTDTPTDTATGTFTETSTATFTVTTTVTETVTETITQTIIDTITETVTQTVTETVTETASETSSLTATETFTATGTPEDTFTQTQSSTQTATVTNTPDDTATITPTITQTPVSTEIFTLTATYTASRTRTATSTPTEIDTQTATASMTVTASETETTIPTATPTIVPTAALPDEVVLFPNPVKDILKVYFPEMLTGDIAEITIYTNSFRKVRLNAASLDATKVLTYDVTGLATGTYLISVKTSRNGREIMKKTMVMVKVK